MIDLLKLCTKMTHHQNRVLSDNHPLCDRLVCAEYSKSAKEVKSYPLIEESRIFVLCWNFSAEHTLHISMCPVPVPFTYAYNTTGVKKTQLHTHDYLELAYIVKGCFRQRILNQDITFQEGEFCLIDKNCIHQDYLDNSDTVILFLGIANDMFSEIMDENITTEKIISFLQSALMKQKDLQQYLHFKPTEGASQQMHECLFLLLSELCNPAIGSSYICKGLLLRIFRLLSTSYEFSLSREQRKTMSWIIFEEVSSYMKQHYSHITIRDLELAFHFQEDYFNRLIKEKTGMTYSAYLQNIRLERAERLLLSTNQTVDEVADAVGYHNKGYFYKIFTKKYGMTPGKYRESQN
ncbi:MAG: AraC family transcriptional regulator [Lachnospiraceae bacterium]|nr:AraC family transcriptional regulator [Lachnospiraceae bacterium]